MNDRDPDDFFDALAGRAPRADANPGLTEFGSELRRTTLAQHGLNPASGASLDGLPTDPAAQERAARVLARLEQQRAFAAPRATPSTTQTQTQPTGWASRVLGWWRGAGFSGPQLGLTAAALAGLALALSLAIAPPVDESEVLRSAPERALSAPDPAATQQRLVAALEDAGAEVVVTQLSDTAWTLTVLVPSEAARPRIDAVLRAEGLPATGVAPNVAVRIQRAR